MYTTCSDDSCGSGENREFIAPFDELDLLFQLLSSFNILTSNQHATYTDMESELKVVLHHRNSEN